MKLNTKINRVNTRINRVPPKKKPAKKQPKGNSPMVVEKQLPVKNIIEVIQPVINLFTDPNAKPVEKKALLVGINYIGTSAQLSGCINDIINMKNNLIQNYGFQESNIVLLTETSKNKKPTKENIIKYISQLIDNNHSNSHLVFHYSGHGSNVKDTNHDEVDGRDETICPLDYGSAGFITDDQLYNILVRPLKSKAKLTCIFDSCHSGTILDLKYTYRLDAKASESASKYFISTLTNYFVPNADVVVYSGCLDKQTSADTSFDGSAQGALTYCFLETLKRLRTGGKNFTIKKVIKNLTLLMAEKQFSQIPQISTSFPSDLNTICDF